MTPDPNAWPDTEPDVDDLTQWAEAAAEAEYAERLDALSAYVAAREAETASRAEPTVTAADAAYERYASIRDQAGQAPEAEHDLELEL